MGKSRIAKRREMEAAEAASTARKKTRKVASETKTETAKKKASRAQKTEKSPAPKKKVAKPRTRRAREAAKRRRIVWVVYSSTMREEGRFLYHERSKAEELRESLIERKKRRYFIQPIKEELNPDGTPVVVATIAPAEEELEEEPLKVEVEVADDIDLDAELDSESDDGGEGDEPEDEAPPEV